MAKVSDLEIGGIAGFQVSKPHYNRGMPFLPNRRWRSVVLLAGGVLIISAILGVLQAFNTSKFLNPETSGETLAFAALAVVVFLVLLLMVMLLTRNMFKLYSDPNISPLGARLRTRMVLGAALIALTPAVCMFIFTYTLMNRSLDRWFSPNISQLRDDSTSVVLELAQYVANNARVEAEAIAATGALDLPIAELQRDLASHRIELDGGFIVVYDRNHSEIARYQAPPERTSVSLLTWLDEGDRKGVALNGPLSSILLPAAQRTDVPTLKIGGDEYALGMSVTSSGKMIVVAQPMPQGLSQTTARIRAGATEYRELFRTRGLIQITYLLLLLVVTVFVFFASVWMAVFLSKQITRPVEALAIAMDEIAAGKYAHRVTALATGEMSDLVRSFNRMAADLETSRQVADSSSAQLTAANQAIEARRRELETIVETIPGGVVTLDGAGTVLQANRAFAQLIGRDGNVPLAGEKIGALFPAECEANLSGLIRRSHRMGAASTEMAINTLGRTVHLALTSARLEFSPGRPGAVLVVEDTTELLRAQRQLAWKEVAQRVAHEIKNPLTPIALSAERIGRHLDRGQPDSQNVIRKCAEVILGCVGTLRMLVDQFSALAEFPASQPKLCDINAIVEEALALFSGRLEGIIVKRELEAGLPTVMADPEAIRRALANLIDNAAEAMQGSLLRVLGIQTALSEDGGAIEITVSDTGHGLTEEIRERLFLPFYSTKNRGTGLGLCIAAKIVQEHGGSIRAESNSPKGARFLLRLPLMEIGGQAALGMPATTEAPLTGTRG